GLPAHWLILPRRDAFYSRLPSLRQGKVGGCFLPLVGFTSLPLVICTNVTSVANRSLIAIVAAVVVARFKYFLITNSTTFSEAPTPHLRERACWSCVL
ncbi:hypothetical protein B0T25DRAFT_468272, partial [Lasiosphaeria hispida]